MGGFDERRSQEFIELFLNPDVAAILTACGGYGAARILPYLDTHKFSPKILLGYSDFTAINNYFLQRFNWVTFQGPCLAKDFDTLSQRGIDSLVAALTQTNPLGKISSPEMISVCPGVAEGILVGGCLSLVSRMLGTPYQLNTDGKILFLEDVGEKPYRIDRMLTHLRQAGLFKQLKGLVFGPLKDTHHEVDYLKDMTREWVGDLNIPVLFNFPSGHLSDSLTIPFGVNVKIDANEPSLTFLEAACQ